MSQIHLIRHSEPALRGVFLGSLDPSLSKEGRRSARQLRGTLAGAAWYSSPMLRARQTASLIAPETVPVILPELAERRFGAWEGLPWHQIALCWPDLAASGQGDWLALTPPGGEPWDRFVIRVARALDVIRAGPLPAIVVAHLAVNAALAGLLCGRDPISFHQNYCEVVTYETTPGITTHRRC
jgi:broad specificity phosphatase PhoE